MSKAYIKIDGKWVPVYRVRGWVDWLCWAWVVCVVGTIGFLLWRNMC